MYITVTASNGMEIKEQKLKTILKEQRTGFQNFIDKRLGEKLGEQEKKYQTYLGAIAEDFSFNLKLIAESVSDLQKQLIAIRDMVARNTENIEIIKTDIEMMKYMLRKKVDIEEFAVLEKRVLALEKNR